jgi:hypothetical protein
MAHFAKIENGIVTQVVVINDSDTADSNGLEQESIGIVFCERLFGGNWKQTSYSGRIRKNYAGIGFTYDSQRDAFIAPQPFPSWTLMQDTLQWIPPIPRPTDELLYSWDEASQSWVEITA